MRYLILADLKSLWRQFAWIFYLCVTVIVLSLIFLGFTYATGLSMASNADDGGIGNDKNEVVETKRTSLDIAVSGGCQSTWPPSWVVHTKNSAAEVDDAIRNDQAFAGLHCADGKAELIVDTTKSLTVIASVGALALMTDDQPIPLENIRPPRSEPDENSNNLMFWGLAVFFIFFPVKVASTLVFEEKNSGRLEWLLGNGVRPHEYLSGKAASLSLTVLTTISVLMITIVLVFLAVIVAAIQSDPQIAFLFEDVLSRTEEASTPLDIVISAGVQFIPKIAGFLVSSILLASLLVVIATSVYLTALSQVRTVTVMEMGMWFTLFLLPIMLEDPAVLWWFPITATYVAMEAAISTGDGVMSIMDLIVPQLVWLGASVALAGTIVTRRMHWSHC